MLFGALYRLSLQTNWERDEAHSAKIVAAKWREIWMEVNAMGCCNDDPSQLNIQINSQLVQNFQVAQAWSQIWISGNSVVSLDYYAIPDTYSTNVGDAGDEIAQREVALCLAVQGWLSEVMNYMESWMIANFEEIAAVAGATLVGSASIGGLVMFPVLIAWATAINIAGEAFLQLRNTEYREYLMCRMFLNLKDKDPDVRADFNEALTADPIGRPQPENFLRDQARDAIELYIRSQLNNLDNYLMFAGQLGTAMDLSRAGYNDCPCLTWEHEFDFTIDEQGWFGFTGGAPPSLRAVYDAGTGWGNARDDQLPEKAQVAIEYSGGFSSTLINEVEIFTSSAYPAGDNANFSFRMPNVSGGDFTNTVPYETVTEKIMPVGVSSTGIWLTVAADTFLFTGHIVKLILKGEGIDPF